MTPAPTADLPSLRRRLRRLVKLLGWCEALADRDITKVKAACQRGDGAGGERHLASANVRAARTARLRQEELRLWQAINAAQRAAAQRAEVDRLSRVNAGLRTRILVRRALFGKAGEN